MATARTVLSVAGWVFAGLTVAACAPDQPGAPPSARTSAITSAPTPTTTAGVPAPAPTMSPAMEGNDEAAAIAAAQYFLDLYDYVYATGDLEEWDRISGQTCAFCASVRADVAAIYEGGGRLTRPSSQFRGFEVIGHDSQLDIYAVLLEFAVLEGSVEEASGTVSTTAAEGGPLRLDVGFSGRGWLLYAADATPDDA